MDSYKVTKRYDPKEINEARRLSGLKEISNRQRSCLRCNKEFISEGIHNRLCESCRKGNESGFVYSARCS